MADVRPTSQHSEPRGSGAAVVIANARFAEDADGWVVVSPAGVGLSEDADGWVVLSDDPAAVTSLRSRVVNSDTLAVY